MSPDRRGRTGAPGHPLPRHRSRCRERVSVAAVLFLVLLASPAAADPCALTDPECLTQPIEETVDTIEKTVGSAGKTVEQAADETTESVDETTTGVVGQVGTVVDGLLGKGGGKDPGGEPGGRTAPGSARPAGRDRRGGDSSVIRRLEPRDPSFDPTFSTQLPVSREARDARSAEARSTLGAVAKRLAFPVLLALAVIAFLVIQNRLDRRDPRLASAPLGPELLTFE